MRDNQNTYLDKVVEFLVRDTKIDYDKEEIQFPFLFSSSIFPISFHLLSVSFLSLLVFPYFPKYCKDTYGLIDQEIKYVWEEYKSIIKNKIKNGR